MKWIVKFRFSQRWFAPFIPMQQFEDGYIAKDSQRKQNWIGDYNGVRYNCAPAIRRGSLKTEPKCKCK